MRLLAFLFPVLLALASSARAEDLVVRVTVGDEPLEGAGVQVQKVSDDGPTFRADKFAPEARTDASGQALVQATSEDRVLVYWPGCELAVVEGGGQLADVALRPERVFSGRVVDSKGDPVVGAAVVLRTTFRRLASFPARTGETGWFQVYGLWFDNYALRIEALGFVDWQDEPEWRSPGEAVTDADSGKTIVLRRTATIAGVVRDQDGKPVAKAQVSAGQSTDETRDDGTYLLGDLEPGRHRVFVAPWGGRSGPVELNEGEVRQGVEVVRLAPATLKLRLVDEEGQGIAGVACRLTGSEIGDYGVKTDTEGRIELNVSPERSGLLRVSVKGHSTATLRLHTLSGATHDLGEVVLRALPEIEVRVRQPDGTPPSNGQVGVFPLVDGTARVTGPRIYAVCVPGYPTVRERVEPPGPVWVTLPTPRWIEGITLDMEGAPIAGVAVSADDDPVAARTDAEGRFRLGPFARGTVWVQARTATTVSEQVEVVLGDGELELHLHPTKPDLLRGRVVRGVDPVPRFDVEGQHFVDEEGRFELFVRRAARDVIEITVEPAVFHFALPPEGQELVARLPGGKALVTLEGGAIGREVGLGSWSGWGEIVSKTQDGGVARFADLAAGVYTARADGFAESRFTIAADAEAMVTLRATPEGSLLVRVPEGFEDPGVRRRTLAAGVYGPMESAHSAAGYRATLDVVRIVAGEETVVDFGPANGGSLLLRGRPDTPVRLTLRMPDATLSFRAVLDAHGAFRFPLLPPGAYTVDAPLRRLEVEIGPGEARELELGGGAHEVEDRVLLWNGKPAQGADVRLFPVDAESQGAKDLTDLRGRFRFANVLPGVYACVARLEGHAQASGTVTVGTDGTVTDGLPLTLVPRAGQHARLLGLVGEPMCGVSVRVDGRWQNTDGLGRLPLDRVPARIDLDLEGLASLRDLEVNADDEIRLVRGATLVVLSDPAAGPPVVRIDGRPWRRLRPLALADDPRPGRLVLEDLPPGPVEIQPPAAPASDGGQVVARLESGAQTTVDLRAR